MHPMVNSAAQTRLTALREILAAHDLDGLLISGPDNRRYLSGFTAREELIHESCGSLLITRDAALLFTDFRYVEWAQAEVSESAYEVLIYQAGLGVLLAEQLKVFGVSRLGFETSYLAVGPYQRLTQTATEAGLQVEWVPTEGLVEGLREVKTREEAALVRQALALTEEVFSEVAGLLCPGLSERRVAWEIERRLRDEGAAVLAFPPIVAAGANSARPHHHPGDYRIKEGEPIIIDMGARVSGYCADLTRTVILGEPTERFREIYVLVRQAQARAEAGLQAGMESAAGDALARDIIKQAGYGEAFGHSLGHGVGLAVHEAPSLSPIKERSTVLQAGSIVTVEPGIYLSGWGGVRLEDMALIQADHCEVLNNLGFYKF
ncbi:MAG: aminopeptidase P family protein [Desulfobaccales bacterium]